jgi:hypothetical protein
MKIISASLLRIEIIKPIKFVSISKVINDWEVNPIFTIGNGTVPNTILQYVDIEIVRQKSTSQASITTRTVFQVRLGDGEFKPTTEEDYQAYTDFIQIAMAHTRVLFQRESRGTAFKDDVLPFEFSTHANLKLRTALSINNN